MNPSSIPWLLCGAFCIGPLVIGTVSFFAWSLFTDRNPVREVSTWTDENGRKHTVTDWSMITREEKKLRNRKEEEEE